MPCGQDQVPHAIAQAQPAAGQGQNLPRPARALILVVLALGVVDGVVKPQGDLHRAPLRDVRAEFIEAFETIFDVMQRVVAPVRRRVGTTQLIKEGRVRGRTQLRPGADPAAADVLVHE